jgi:glyoxylase-like metal-dependent hydrolase (beta-lactamase superfamily II)/rhodanese-related sulfurtransferase
MFEIITVETSSLGDRSYLVHDGATALVVDPQRDIDRVLDLAGRLGVTVTHVLETHVHNDYVTGGHALARATGATYLVNAADPLTIHRTPITDGDAVRVSPTLTVRALATPGHTWTHLSYLLETDGQPVAVFTGGSMLYGSSGRPDLLGPDHTESLARAQYASLHKLAAELPDDVQILPTHGFGSFCSATQTSGTSSTIGREKRVNPALTQDEQTYLEQLLAGLDAYPAYYAHMGAANLSAPDQAPDLSLPHLADPTELRRRVEAGEWVVDLRTRSAFAAGHLTGALSIGLDGSFATYLGWLVPWGTPLTLLGQTPEQVTRAQRELVRIGIDRPAAAATGTPSDWTGHTPPQTLRRATYTDLAAVLEADHGPGGTVTVLDVRRTPEWRDRHIADAVHIPLHDLPHRLTEVPEGQIWVHCQSGYRASIAASLLAAQGRDVVLVDDDFTHAAGAGVQLTDRPDRTRPRLARALPVEGPGSSARRKVGTSIPSPPSSDT